MRQKQANLIVKNYIILLLESENMVSLEFNSCLRFDSILQKVAHKTAQKVTLLRRIKHFLDSDILMTFYKDPVRVVMECSPLTWMSSACCLLNPLDKVHK